MNRRDVLRIGALSGVAGVLSGGTAGTAAASSPLPAQPGTGPWRIQIVMFDGVEELDFAAPFEVFSAADFWTKRGVDVRLVSAQGPRKIRASFGMEVDVPHPLDPASADLLVVPGGGYKDRNGPGIWAEIKEGTLPKALADAPRPGLTIASICVGAMLLGEAGLVRGRPCTTHNRAKQTLSEQGGDVRDARVVDDGDLVTAGGITSGLELGLWLVGRELGSQAAVNLEQVLEYETRGTVLRTAAAS